MKLVSETTDAQRAQAARETAQGVARWHFDVCLRLLTANLIRVTRGAGEGYQIAKQAQDLLEAAQAFQEAFGHWPSSEDYSQPLQHEAEVVGEWGPQHDRQAAIDRIVRGSLQIAASRILDQSLQISAGEREMDGGIRELERWWEDRRAEFAARERAFIAPTLRAASKPKTKAKRK